VVFTAYKKRRGHWGRGKFDTWVESPKRCLDKTLGTATVRKAIKHWVLDALLVTVRK